MKKLSAVKILIAIALMAVGFAAFGALNTFFAATNEMEFCTSCHSMKINLEEFQETPHYKNASGVQATCADCHVPKEFFPKVYAKVMAAKDVYHEIMGTVDTREKYEAHRWYMANRVWDKMKANDSRECRTCHDFETMDTSAQDRSARRKHEKAPMKGQTCIDCHKGVAHEEPDEPDDWAEAEEAAEKTHG